MATRRQFLKCLILAPLTAQIPVQEKSVRPRTEIWWEDHCLSRESAHGFQLLLSGQPMVELGSSIRGELPSAIIVPGIRHLSIARCSELLQLSRDGTWLILETGSCFLSTEESRRQAALFERAFDVEVLPPVPVSKSGGKDTYIEYVWPIRGLVRTFGAITPILCKPNEMIACLGRRPVCVKKRVGKGGLIYLGTMLGPGLFAEEREALAIGAAMMSSLTC